MPTQPGETKPPRMHGIVPTPYEIPTEHLPVSKPAKSAMPLFLRLIILFVLAKAGFYLLLALIPWSDPQSDVASFLLARPALVLGMIPRPLLLCEESMQGCVVSRIVHGLPIVFLFLGLIYLFSAWKLFNLDKFWTSIIRWGIMFQTGATVLKTIIALSARYVGETEAPLSDAMRLALFIFVIWNLFIFCCFAYFPSAEDAYDSKA
jgi:hypothetical protein